MRRQARAGQPAGAARKNMPAPCRSCTGRGPHLPPRSGRCRLCAPPPHLRRCCRHWEGRTAARPGAVPTPSGGPRAGWTVPALKMMAAHPSVVRSTLLVYNSPAAYFQARTGRAAKRGRAGDLAGRHGLRGGDIRLCSLGGQAGRFGAALSTVFSNTRPPTGTCGQAGRFGAALPPSPARRRLVRAASWQSTACLCIAWRGASVRVVRNHIRAVRRRHPARVRPGAGRRGRAGPRAVRTARCAFQGRAAHS